MMNDKPVIRDAETGVVYGSTRLFTKQSNPGGIEKLAEEPLSEYDIEKTITGRVLATRVVSYQGEGATHMQTTLSIDVDESPYRLASKRRSSRSIDQ